MTKKREESLQERVERQRRERGLPAREGHEVGAGGKELRTPTEDEFFSALEKASDPSTDEGAEAP
jgi:hypothetical protein